MEDLFDQLKAEGPLKKSISVSPSKSKYTESVEEFNEKHKSSSIRRESLPSPITVSNIIKKSKSHKARSLSPPKFGVNSGIKSLKVKLERKKLEEFLTHPLEEHANNIRNKQETFKDNNKQPKVTPTKAQQKLFEPSSPEKNNTKARVLKEFNIKPCRVRIHRDNLQKLAREFKKKYAAKKDGKYNATKRPATERSDSPPLKKGKLCASDAKNTSQIKTNFFIKLGSSPATKIEKKLKTLTAKPPSSSSVALHNKIKNSKFDSITTPTKFSRSQLLRSFGKRFFNVQVKIERCTHPLMLTFESNDRARRLQAKRNNKSKNLSVSFRDQVEVFGGSSDSDDSCDEDFTAVPNRNGRKNNSSHKLPVPATPVVMPARLKKVENGKVVDDIELDPSLFVDPKALVSSTPFSPCRKKRDHKSFSPLKDETSPSPRKEQLKLANERIPPSGLRRLNIDEEDDEDDDCEYIVPIEMPQRRASRTSSNDEADPDNFRGLFDDDVSMDNIDFTIATKTLDKNNHDLTGQNAKHNDKQKDTYTDRDPATETKNLENGSDDSFQSAKDSFFDNSNEADNNKVPAMELSNTLRSNYDLDTTKASDGKESLQQRTNANGCNDNGTMDNISLNLFLEDSQTNDDVTNAKSFVDSFLINETIDKLSKDIDEGSTDTT